MDTKPNLAPFYVGQRVVAVNAALGSAFKNGTQYVIDAVEYNFGNPHHPVGRITKYWYVGIQGFPKSTISDRKAYYCPSIFAPVEQMDFPAIKLSEIIQSEVLEVMIAN
jgi:hypothetical protein